MKSTSPWLSNEKDTAILQSLLQEQSDYRWNVNERTRTFLSSSPPSRSFYRRSWAQTFRLHKVTTADLTHRKKLKICFSHLCEMWHYTYLLLKKAASSQCVELLNPSSLRYVQNKYKKKISVLSSFLNIVLTKVMKTNKQIKNKSHNTLW